MHTRCVLQWQLGWIINFSALEVYPGNRWSPLLCMWVIEEQRWGLCLVPLAFHSSAAILLCSLPPGSKQLRLATPFCQDISPSGPADHVLNFLKQCARLALLLCLAFVIQHLRKDKANIRSWGMQVCLIPLHIITQR